MNTKRINYLACIYDKVVGLDDLERNLNKAKLYSIFPIDPAFKQKISERVAQYLQKDVDLEFITDPGILGGIKLTIQDKVIDATLLYKLKKMEEKIAQG